MPRTLLTLLAFCALLLGQRAAPPPELVARARMAAIAVDKGIGRQDELRNDGKGHIIAAIPEYASKAQSTGAFSDVVLHARILALAGAIADAEVRFNDARSLEPASPWPVFGIATCKALGGEVAAAISLFEETLHLDPAWWRSFEPLSGLYLKTGRPVDAERMLSSLVKVRADDSGAFAALGQLRLLIGQAGSSADAYGRALALRPGDSNLRRAFGIACRRAGRYDEARKAFEAEIALRPLDFRAHLQLAYLEEWQGRNGAAAERFRAAADLAPSPEDRETCLTKAGDLDSLPQQDATSAMRRTPAQWAELLATTRDPKIAQEAAMRLAAMPISVPESTKAMLAGLRHPVPAVRVLAIRTLSTRFPGSVDFFTIFRILSRDADRGVRAMAIRALGEIGTDEVVPALIPLLAEKDPYVFREVHGALYRCAPAFVSPILPTGSEEGTAMTRIAKEWDAWWTENSDRYRRFLR